MINSKVHEIIDKYIPNNHRKLINGAGDSKIAAFECDRKNELRIMKVHYENSKQSGLNIIGIIELIKSLGGFDDDEIFLINLSNENYFSKIYMNKKLNILLGYIIIKSRKKHEEAIKWGRDVLGIKSLPPNM